MSSTGSTQESAMATKKADKAGRSDAKQTPKPAAKGGAVAITLPETMNGKDSAAKAAVGDKPVFAYIASLPQPQRGIAERIAQLPEVLLPGLERSVKSTEASRGGEEGV